MSFKLSVTSLDNKKNHEKCVNKVDSLSIIWKNRREFLFCLCLH